jgi:hypothetical protein
MAMVDRFTGLTALTCDLIDGLSEAYLLDPPVEEMGYQSIETTLLRLRHPDLVEMIAAAEPGTLRAVSEEAATSALACAGLDNDQRALSVTSAFGGAVPAEFGREALALLIAVNRESDAIEATDPLDMVARRAPKWFGPGCEYGPCAPSNTQPTRTRGKRHLWLSAQLNVPAQPCCPLLACDCPTRASRPPK